MIETLEITNFKSVKHLTLPCKRFNVFIGEPNTGKSNILEALGLLSFVGTRQCAPDTALDGFVRHERMSNLFHDEDVGEPLSVRCGDAALELAYRDGWYHGEYTSEGERAAAISGDQRTITGVDCSPETVLPPIRFYRSPVTEGFRPSPCDYLLPPHGSNLLDLLATNRELGQRIGSVFSGQDLKLWLRPHENKIDVIRNFDDMVITSFPYSLVSETLQRSTFYTAALKTNRNAVIVLEEPETHSFPHHVNHLGERVALEGTNNQYFITTHNSDFLMGLLEKSMVGQLAINVVYSRGHKTRATQIPSSDFPDLFEFDVIANLDRYLEP